MVLMLLQAYIDFEINAGERAAARAVYERLLQRTTHVKVWLSYAAFEAAPLPVDEEDEEAVALAEERRASGEESSAVREAKARRYALQLSVVTQQPCLHTTIARMASKFAPRAEV